MTRFTAFVAVASLRLSVVHVLQLLNEGIDLSLIKVLADVTADSTGVDSKLLRRLTVSLITTHLSGCPVVVVGERAIFGFSGATDVQVGKGILLHVLVLFDGRQAAYV